MTDDENYCENEVIRKILIRADRKNIFKTHIGGYNMICGGDTVVEYGNGCISVFVPYKWHVAPKEVKNEVVEFAYRNAIGDKFPKYGPITFEYLRKIGARIPEDVWNDYKEILKSRKKMFDMGYSDWTVACAIGKPIGGTYRFDNDTITRGDAVDAGEEDKALELRQLR